MSSSSRPASSDTSMGVPAPTTLSYLQKMEINRKFAAEIASLQRSFMRRTSSASPAPTQVMAPQARTHALLAPIPYSEGSGPSWKKTETELGRKLPTPQKLRNTCQSSLSSVNIPDSPPFRGKVRHVSTPASVRGMPQVSVDIYTPDDSTKSLCEPTDGHYHKLRSHSRRVPHEPFPVSSEYMNYPFVEPSMYGASLVQHEIAQPLTCLEYTNLCYQKGGEMFEYFQLSHDSTCDELERLELEVVQLRKEKKNRSGRSNSVADKLVVVEAELDNLTMEVTRLEACLTRERAKSSSYASEVTRLTQQVNALEITSTGYKNLYEIANNQIRVIRQEEADHLASVVECFRQRGLSEHPDLDWASLLRVSPDLDSDGGSTAGSASDGE